MKILVTVKRVPDPETTIRVKPDNSGIVTDNVKYVINPFDEIGIEEGLRIKEKVSGSEVILASIGAKVNTEQLRTGLAMGADRALLVICEEELDPLGVSRILAKLIEDEKPDLVLMGKQAIDDDSNQAGQMVAALKGWPQATFASNLTFADDRLQVDREIDTGLETIRVSLPAVVSTDLRLNEPRYASLTRILKARKQSIQQLPLSELDIELEPRVEIRQLETTAATRNCEFVRTAAELINCLRDDANLLD